MITNSAAGGSLTCGLIGKLIRLMPGMRKQGGGAHTGHAGVGWQPMHAALGASQQRACWAGSDGLGLLFVGPSPFVQLVMITLSC